MRGSSSRLPRELSRTFVTPTRKIAAILNADVVGYSRLMREDDLATLQDLLAMRQLVDAQVRAHDGRLVDTAGDSMLADFASAVAALRCAVAVQQALAQRNAGRPEERCMRLRIGLNVGDILEQGSALYGDGVNVAARLQALGEPGGVCLSAALHDLVEGHLPLAFEYAGEQSMKNIDRPVGVFHVRMPGVDCLDAAAGAMPSGASARRGRHNLPQALSSFVGRQHEIAALRRLTAEHRLVTLVGPGGIGKTRLALQVGQELLNRFADGVWLIELAALADARLLVQRVATELGIKEVAGRPLLQVLLQALHGKRLLIVLDNCEHVAQACADLAARLLAATPQVHLLATSREPLRISGEVNLPVPALTLPGEGDRALPQRLCEFDAVRLFVDRAASRSPGFRLTATNVAAVLRICRCLDGIPLALELAAARVRVLSVEQIALRLKDRFDLLAEGDRSALPRQQSLRALIDWSHELLDARERAVFRRLAVFAGGWTLGAAEAVAAGGAIDASEVVDVLGRLVEKSLVLMVGDGERYRLLETMRQYALEQLAAAGEGDATQDRHLAHYLALAETARRHLSGSQQREWLERLDVERGNLLAARERCPQAANGADAALRLMLAVKLYLYNRGQLELLRWGTMEALALPAAHERTQLRCRALHTLGQVCYHLGRCAEAGPHLLEALSIAQELQDDGREVMVLQELGITALSLGDVAAARCHLQAGMALAHRCGDKRALAAAVNAMAQLHRSVGELERAAPLYEQALALARELDDEQSIAVALLNLAMVAIGQGDQGVACERLLEADRIARALGSRPTGQCGLAVASGLAALREEWTRAVRSSAAAEAEAGNTGVYLEPADKQFLTPLWERARKALGEAAHRAAQAAGQASGYEHAMDEARAWLASTVRSADTVE